MILRFLFYAFLLYVAFRFVFGFVVPVYRTTRKVRRGFRAMQAQMKEQGGQGEQPAAPRAASPARPPAGEYIDFEEIK